MVPIETRIIKENNVFKIYVLMEDQWFLDDNDYTTYHEAYISDKYGNWEDTLTECGDLND